MNAAKMTLVSAVVAAALGLALGLAAPPAVADQPVEGVHGHGGDNGDVLASPLDVILDELKGPIDDASGCTGITAPPSVLAVDFDHGCTITLLAPDGFTDLVLSLFRLEVRTRKNGVTDIALFLGTEKDFSPGNHGDV